MLHICLWGTDRHKCYDVINNVFGPLPWKMKIYLRRNIPWRKMKRINRKLGPFWDPYSNFRKEGGYCWRNHITFNSILLTLDMLEVKLCVNWWIICMQFANIKPWVSAKVSKIAVFTGTHDLCYSKRKLEESDKHSWSLTNVGNVNKDFMKFNRKCKF